MIFSDSNIHFQGASRVQKRLALAIIDFLSTSLNDGTLTSEDAESIEVAQSCIADTFHVDPTDKSAMHDAIGGQSLLSIYGVYEKLKDKSTATATATSGVSEVRPSSSNIPKGNSNPSVSPTSTETNAEAESFKSQGNAAMQRKDYEAAIDLYSKAIAISPLNPIYLSNRAAAYSASHKHAEAQTDAEMAVAADPKYTKAWSRLGLARYVLGDAKGSMEAYAKGIEYEGNGGSEAMKKGFKTAKEKLEDEEKQKDDEDMDEIESIRSGGVETGAGAGAGGLPDLASLAGMLGGGRGAGGGGAGGGPDLSSIMNNPMFANMAQNLMSNPDAMSNLMKNPQLRQMAESFGLGGGGGGGGASGGEGRGAGAGRGGGGGGGGGGMPDLASLMQDPNIAEMCVLPGASGG